LRFFTIPSLRWRLVTVMCLAYVIVAVATEVVAYSTQQRNLHSQLLTRAENEAAILATGSFPYISGKTLPLLQTFVETIHKSAGVQYAAVIAGNGCVAASSIPSEVRHCSSIPGNLANQAFSVGNGDVEGRYQIVRPDNPFGFAKVILSGNSIDTALNQTLLTDLLLRGIGLVMFLLLSLAIAQYILGPLTFLSRAADSIRRGQLATRVPAAGRTELVTLAGAFNDMAAALEQRIKHLSFLAAAASVLPGLFRDKGDISPTLAEFCRQLEAVGAGLIPRDEKDRRPLWFDSDRHDVSWHVVARSLGEAATAPTAAQRDGWALMAVPVLGDTLFVVARDGRRPFTQEEQQVITNFAYQLGIASDNARLFEEQQEALRVKDQFLSIVSHELRTPLTTIKGYSQMLRRKITDDPTSQRFATNIDVQVSRLSRLVDDLLDVTRFSRGQFELKRQHVDLRPLVEDVVARFRIVAPTHSFALNLDHGSFEGFWDRDRLEQVMNNLIGNAIKYSPPGSTVTVSTRHTDSELIVAVYDEGVGIPEAEQERLFERFFRGSAEGGSVSGMGLGLYVSQRIVDAHGGEVGVRSALNEGSEFYFSLPLAPSAVAASYKGLPDPAARS
jgi:signal transduction histidine kinase